MSTVYYTCCMPAKLLDFQCLFNKNSFLGLKCSRTIFLQHSYSNAFLCLILEQDIKKERESLSSKAKEKSKLFPVASFDKILKSSSVFLSTHRGLSLYQPTFLFLIFPQPKQAMSIKTDLHEQASQKVHRWFTLPFTWNVTPMELECCSVTVSQFLGF